MTEKFPFPGWDKNKPQESLEEIYKWTIQNAENQIGWYERKKKPKRIGSQLIRFLAIVLAGIGALCPLLDATKAFGDFILAQWGYVFLALSAGIAGFDYYFGYSTGWMRKIVTQIALERNLKEFQYDWTILKINTESDARGFNPVGYLNLAKEFTLRVENLVKQETDVWVAEFQTNINQLEKMLKTEIESRKTGSIKVVVTNCADFDKVMIYSNGIQIKELVSVSEGIINTVSPGSYELVVIGKKGDKESKQSKVVEVQAGVMSAVEFSLNL